MEGNRHKFLLRFGTIGPINFDDSGRFPFQRFVSFCLITKPQTEEVYDHGTPVKLNYYWKK